MSEFLQRLKKRRLMQWALAYVAAAFALQGLYSDPRQQALLAKTGLPTSL